ncbi:MEDS domain-containing protein [Pseudonocardia bannensis]|uniref:MEDS domain-containing protein n=1 Tax=Pseudonocardia bannensis TaxID=630973 RepID=A0A848DL51_9PSEU|nr:MEDS domain-containing protein [Pseudonocardia bannensis]NMH93285.1 hypothetical protein [Pseudonocardia bannensis]
MKPGGDHVCALHTSTRWRDEVLLSFLRDGLVEGHKCLVALSDPDPSGLVGGLGSRAEVERWLASRQLEVRGAADMIGSPDELSIENMIDFWRAVLSSALGAEGYAFARLAAEANWWMPQLSGIAQLLRYEMRLNGFSRRYPAAILCLYDVSTLDGALVMDLVRTHPKVLLDGVPFNNPYYIPPEEFLDR